MSYILEALRRSQAERERGRVPGLDAQPLPADPSADPRRGLPIAWVSSGVGVVLLLIAVLVATWWVQPQPRAPQAPAAGADTTTAALPPPRAALPAPQPAPAPLPQVVSVLPVAPPTRTAVPSPAASAAAPPQLQPAPAAAVQPAPVPPRALTLGQLSADQRRELPPMVVGGSVWSDNAANRFVIVNGQVIREGETAAPGVTLERIAPKSATLRWRDLRIELAL